MRNEVMKWCAPAFLCAGLLGCSADSGPQAVIEKVVPAEGTLTYQGRPLDYFQISVQPTDGRRAAVGVTDAQGKFKLGTNASGDGAPPGTHKLAVAWAGPPPAEAGLEPIIDDPNLIPKPKVKLPGKLANPETSGLTLEIPEGGSTTLQVDLK